MRSVRHIFSLALCLTTLPLIALIVPPSSNAPLERRLLIGPLRSPAYGPAYEWISTSEGRIVDVVPFAAMPKSQARSQMGVGAGLFATPGLIDNHVHLPPAVALGQLDFILLMLLSHGVTSVRELGSPYLDVDDLQRSIRIGKRVGPRVFSCGLPLTGSRAQFPFLDAVSSKEELDQAIAKRAQAGLSCIKVYRGFPAHLLTHAKETSDRLGLMVVGHLPHDAPWNSTEVADLQHACDPRCSSLSPVEIEAMAEGALSGDLRHTPTLVTFENPLDWLAESNPTAPRSVLPRVWIDFLWDPNQLAKIGVRGFLDARTMQIENDSARRSVRSLIQAGALLQVGTDTPFPFVIPGVSVHEEMQILAELGLSINEVWSAATANPGSLLSRESLGQLVRGAPADLLLFREDPTADLRALSTLEYVIADGRVYPIKELRHRVKQQLKYLNGPVYEYGLEPALRFAIKRFPSNPRSSRATAR